LRDNIEEAGYVKPMPIQMQGIPIGMHNRDLIGLAPTGSGKSAAFLLPLINNLLKLPPVLGELIQDGPYSIIMAPTRELAI
jgi:ATP-dependent RNA helicase DDX23/PRP28